jgi:AcrR family transcriptional regulator
MTRSRPAGEQALYVTTDGGFFLGAELLRSDGPISADLPHDPHRQLHNGIQERHRWRLPAQEKNGQGLDYIPTGRYDASTMKKLRPAETSRQRILQIAFGEFFRFGFQGGSLNRIVEESGLTKGALFHHFAGKHELGYAVVDELIWPEFKASWIDPMEHSEDPIKDMKGLLRQMAEEGVPGGSLVQGCPVNNLAQEMSPLDEGFRQRLEKIYTAWRSAVASAIAKGIKAGKVKKGVSPVKVAAFVVAAIEGIIGTVKNAQNPQLLGDAGDALLDYLDSLRP